MSVLSGFNIRRHRPYYYVILVIVAIALTFLIQRYVYLKTTQVQQQKFELYQQLDDAHQSLRADTKALNDKLMLRNANLDSQQYEIDIQQATISTLEQQLNTLQGQLALLNKELVFYQAITQGDRPKKLQIRELRLRADSTNSDIVHYRVVITQGAKINQALAGTIEIVVNSFQKEKLAPVFLRDHLLNLRHVQIIEGQVKLAEKIIPENITIAIIQNKKQLLTQSFNWQLSPPSE